METRRSFTEMTVAWRRLVLRLTIIAGLGAIVVSLLLPRWYSSGATIRPPSEGEGGLGLMALMDQLGSNVGVGRARSLLKRTPQIDMMIGVLKSRRIRGQVVDEFDLMDRYDSKTRQHAIKELGEHLHVNTTPEGFVEVRADARDPELAAELANAFVEYLDRYNRETSVEDARRTSEFLGERLEENGVRMERAAEELRRFQEEYGAIQIAEQTRVTVEAMAELEAERMRLEIQKGVLQNYERGDQPRVREIETRIVEIQKRLTKLWGSAPTAMVEGVDDEESVVAEADVFIPLGDFPGLGLRFANLRREVLVQEKVYEFLTAQFEEARIREARDLETVKVLDGAVPPIRKSRPRRSLIVVLTVGLAVVLSLGLAFASEALLDAARPGPEWTKAREVRWLLGAADALRRWGGPTAV